MERQAPTESGRARLGKEPALCQEALDLAIFYQPVVFPRPPPSMLPAARPSSWQSGDRPGSRVPHPPPLPGCPKRCPSPFHCLSREGAGDKHTHTKCVRDSDFLRDRAAISLLPLFSSTLSRIGNLSELTSLDLFSEALSYEEWGRGKKGFSRRERRELSCL